MLWLINILLICLFGIYEWHVCDQMDSGLSKVKGWTRIAIAALITFALVMLLYIAFGVNDYNLGYYIKHRGL